MIDKTQIDQDVRAQEAIFCSPFLMCDFVTSTPCHVRLDLRLSEGDLGGVFKQKIRLLV